MLCTKEGLMSYISLATAHLQTEIWDQCSFSQTPATREGESLEVMGSRERHLPRSRLPIPSATVVRTRQE